MELLDGSSGFIRITTTQLVLTVTDVTDTGVYNCTATNNVGFDASAAYLVVLGKRRVFWLLFFFYLFSLSATPNTWVCNPAYLVPVPNQNKMAGFQQEGHLT